MASSDIETRDMSHHEYASTTDLILQNLTMIIGNPSARCYANAPWMRAYLAEFNMEPWGTLKDAVSQWTSRVSLGLKPFGNTMT